MDDCNTIESLRDIEPLRWSFWEDEGVHLAVWRHGRRDFALLVIVEQFRIVPE